MNKNSIKTSNKIYLVNLNLENLIKLRFKDIFLIIQKF